MTSRSAVGLLLIWVAAWAVAAPASKVRPMPTESIVGEWVCDGDTHWGERHPATEPNRRWSFTPDGRWLIVKDGTVVSEGRFSADRAADPATLDLSRGDKPGDRNRCIYRIDDDELSIGFGWGGAERPAAFDSPRGAKRSVYHFKRATKD
jgi:uncharacterized protein (TIGR03067 family)